MNTVKKQTHKTTLGGPHIYIEEDPTIELTQSGEKLWTLEELFEYISNELEANKIPAVITLVTP